MTAHKVVEPQLAALIETGDVSFEYKHLVVLGARSQWAAEANECAGDQDMFWAYNSMLFEKSGKVNFTTDNLKQWAKDLGLQTESFNQCFDKKTHVATIDSMKADARSLAIQSTPTFVLNGKVLKVKDYSEVITAVKQAVK
ncbi:MAG: oxidoreductase [Symbiobacteriaceae bacterium]|nr:oxidoreductase [Symbiobacteriaceae bacterium]